MSIELRRDVRKRTFLKGRIIFNGGNSTMDCLIRDMSESGARLELSETATLPDVFDLYIPSKDATQRVSLCWRRAGDVGINFADVPQQHSAAEADGATAVLKRRIAELEAENAALRTLLVRSHQPNAA